MLLWNQLESLVRQYHLADILDCLSGIVGRKAEDNPETAEQWEKAESALNAATSKVLNLRGI